MIFFPSGNMGSHRFLGRGASHESSDGRKEVPTSQFHSRQHDARCPRSVGAEATIQVQVVNPSESNIEGQILGVIYGAVSDPGGNVIEEIALSLRRLRSG